MEASTRIVSEEIVSEDYIDGRRVLETDLRHQIPPRINPEERKEREEEDFEREIKSLKKELAEQKSRKVIPNMLNWEIGETLTAPRVRDEVHNTQGSSLNNSSRQCPTEGPPARQQ